MSATQSASAGAFDRGIQAGLERVARLGLEIPSDFTGQPFETTRELLLDQDEPVGALFTEMFAEAIAVATATRTHEKGTPLQREEIQKFLFSARAICEAWRYV
jgi:hypothetical protein